MTPVVHTTDPPEPSLQEAVQGADVLSRIALERMQKLWPFACKLGQSLSVYEDAEDLWQDVTVKIWEQIAKGHLDREMIEGPTFIAYARRALLRRYLEIVRFHTVGKRDHRLEASIDDIGEHLVPDEPKENRDDLDAALHELPEEWEHVIRGKYLEGKTLKEAGAEAGLSSSNISKGIGRRLSQLRAILTSKTR